jgi:very-short-patch-repair endonuclease
MSTQTGKDNPRYKHIEVSCRTCGKAFLKKPSHVSYCKNQFCSRECLDAYLKTDEAKDFNRKKMLETLSVYPRKTKPEKLVAKCLRKLKIEFEEQKIINNKFCVDFLIEDKKSKGIVIEVLGDYFHCNPEKYDEPINKMQKQNRANDKRRYNYLTKCGYTVFGIWENYIIENPKAALSPVLEYMGTFQLSLFAAFTHAR